jgi:hypothetical protein
MFFVLSKLLGVFAFPSNVAILIGVLGLLLLPTRFARAGRWLTFASVLVLAILGLSPLGNMLLFPLENHFPPWDARAERLNVAHLGRSARLSACGWLNLSARAGNGPFWRRQQRCRS